MLMTHLSRWPAGFALAAVVWLGAANLRALPANDAQAVSVSPPVLNPAAAAAFADTIIPAAMRERKIPGAVFVVVQGNRVLCEKAFGVADLKTQKPVSTGQTLFRVASISKILTAASALQLVDAGKLDLHRDVNDYLARFQIASTFARPVTLFHLLTHSGGFDENEAGYAARSVTNRLSLRAYLIAHQPARVRPPGWFSVYDNYGFALAGYLVQRASGLPFGDYVRREIFDPLAMEHSSFSPGGKLRKHLATGYWLDQGTPQACGPDYVNITPAAGLCTTAADMADFLAALLANRRPDGAKFLPDDVLRGLETQQFASSPDVPGRCYGFDCVSIGGRSALRQPGQWPGFDAALMLFPRQHCGLFLAYNLCDDEHLDRLVTRRFAEQFIPPDPSQGRMPAKAATDENVNLPAASLTGYYLSTRATYEAPELNFPRQVRLSLSPGGKLMINGQPYREIKPAVFEKIGINAAAVFLGRRVAFLPEQDGKQRLVTQTTVFRRVPWVESQTGQAFLLRAATMVFVSAMVLWLVMGLMRPAFARTPKESTQTSAPAPVKLGAAARGTALATCLLALWFEAAFAIAESNLRPFAGFYGFPAPLQNLMWAPPALLALTIALAVFTVLAWRRRWWHPLHRLHFTLVTIAGATLLYIFYTRHLLFPA